MVSTYPSRLVSVIQMTINDLEDKLLSWLCATVSSCGFLFLARGCNASLPLVFCIGKAFFFPYSVDSQSCWLLFSFLPLDILHAVTLMLFWQGVHGELCKLEKRKFTVRNCNILTGKRALPAQPARKTPSCPWGAFWALTWNVAPVSSRWSASPQNSQEVQAICWGIGFVTGWSAKLLWGENEGRPFNSNKWEDFVPHFCCLNNKCN